MAFHLIKIMICIIQILLLRQFLKKSNNSIEILKIYETEGPDGSTIDIFDRYYSCLWGGSRIDIFENNNIVNSIDLNFKFPTSCCFGGIDMNKLFITSAYNNGKDNGSIEILDIDTIAYREKCIKY